MCSNSSNDLVLLFTWENAYMILNWWSLNSRIYDAGLMDKLDYLEAEAVLRREHKIELDYIEKMEKRTNGYWILWALILAMLAWMGF